MKSCYFLIGCVLALYGCTPDDDRGPSNNDDDDAFVAQDTGDRDIAIPDAVADSSVDRDETVQDVSPDSDAVDEPEDVLVDESADTDEVADPDLSEDEVDGGEEPDECEGITLASGLMDIDLQAVSVSGQITLDGDILPDESLDRGRLRFVSSEGQLVHTAWLGTTGSGSYDVTLSPDTYDVVFDANENLCQRQDSLMPCIDGVVLPAVDLTASGVLDVDLTAVLVSGRVTLNGGSMPDEALDRGRLAFVGSRGETAYTDWFGASESVSYELTLLSGTYDIRFDANESLCLNEVPSVPCVDGLLSSSVSLTTGGVFDVDIEAVQVSGQVTLDGTALPDEARDRGRLVFMSEDGASAYTAWFGATGAISYSVTLIPGSYAVILDGNEQLCLGDVPSMPCGNGPITSSQRFTASGVYDVDLDAVEVSGRVTLDGATLPDEVLDRGRLVFTLEDGSAAYTDWFGAAGAVEYTITLLPGDYTVSLDGNETLCARETSAVPCIDGVLQEVTLSADGVLDLDMEAVTVSGDVTLDGESLPEERSDRGRVSFALSDGGRTYSNWFGATGPVSYEVMLLSGRYDVWFDGNETLCSDESAVPCVDGKVLTSVSLTADGVLDINLESIVVSGRVTLEGETLPDEALDRGRLIFGLVEGGMTFSEWFGSSGAVSYNLRLLRGDYLVTFDANEQLCARPESSEVPCIGYSLLGCPE